MSKISRYYFPFTEVTSVHQDGSEASVNRGLEVELYTRDNESAPCVAGLASEDYDAEIGFTFEGKTLIGFDGAFELPRELALLLRRLGYVIAKEFSA